MYKARFIVQKHTDAEKNMLVHASFNIRTQTVKRIIALVTIFDIRMWSQDVSQTYVQSASHLTRDDFVNPRHGCKIQSFQLLKLFKPLSVLSDKTDYWHAMMTNQLKEDFGKTLTTGDLARFVKKINSSTGGEVELQNWNNDKFHEPYY